MDILHSLAHYVGRAFYPPEFVVILDTLCREKTIKDELMANKLKLHLRIVRRILAQLREDCLINTEIRMEPRLGDKHLTPRTYWYIDYKQFVDVVKYKLYKMQLLIKGNNPQGFETQRYSCPRCHHTYSILDAQTLLDPHTFVFMCEFCHTELHECDETERISSSQHALARFMEQVRPIISFLKKTESLVIPSYSRTSGDIVMDVRDLQTMIQAGVYPSISSGDQVPMPDHAGHPNMAASAYASRNLMHTPSMYWGPDTEITVQIEEDDKGLTENGSTRKRHPLSTSPNADSNVSTMNLPVWMVESTIIPKRTGTEPVDQEDSVHSFMTSGHRLVQPPVSGISTNIPLTMATMETITEDEDLEADYEEYYSNYYAELQRQQEALETLQSELDTGTTEIGDQEEPRNSSPFQQGIQAESSIPWWLSESTHTQSPIFTSETRSTSDETSDVEHDRGRVNVQRSSSSVPVESLVDDTEAESSAGCMSYDHIPMIQVGEEQMLLTDVTEEHKARMTVDEYLIYYEQYQQYLMRFV